MTLGKKTVWIRLETQLMGSQSTPAHRPHTRLWPVIISSDLSWEKQIHASVARAKSMSAWIFNVFKSRDVPTSLLRNGKKNDQYLEIILPDIAEVDPVRICQLMHSILVFLTISNFGFNRLGSKLVGMFLGIVWMFVAKDFVRRRFVALDMCKLRRPHTFRPASTRRSDAKQSPLVRIFKLSQGTCLPILNLNG